MQGKGEVQLKADEYQQARKNLKGPILTERMKLEAVGKIMDQLFSQFPALVVTPREDEGPPLLTAEEIDAR